MVEEAGLVYRAVSEIRGPLLFIEGVRGISFGEVARIATP